MLWHDTWPGGHNVAYSPAIWRRMFEIIPDDNFGLNYDPSHLIWQFIDEVRPDHRVQGPHLPRPRQGHAHRPRDALPGRHPRLRLPLGNPPPAGSGRGALGRLIAALYAIGYDYVISIEHEDRAFEGTEELVKRGFYLTRDVLAPYIV